MWNAFTTRVLTTKYTRNFAKYMQIRVLAVLHHEHVEKHTSYICMYTRFFTHACASNGYTRTQYYQEYDIT